MDSIRCMRTRAYRHHQLRWSRTKFPNASITFTGIVGWKDVQLWQTIQSIRLSSCVDSLVLMGSEGTTRLVGLISGWAVKFVHTSKQRCQKCNRSISLYTYWRFKEYWSLVWHRHTIIELIIIMVYCMMYRNILTGLMRIMPGVS